MEVLPSFKPISEIRKENSGNFFPFSSQGVDVFLNENSGNFSPVKPYGVEDLNKNEGKV